MDKLLSLLASSYSLVEVVGKIKWNMWKTYWQNLTKKLKIGKKIQNLLGEFNWQNSGISKFGNHSSSSLHYRVLTRIFDNARQGGKKL